MLRRNHQDYTGPVIQGFWGPQANGAPWACRALKAREVTRAAKEREDYMVLKATKENG